MSPDAGKMGYFHIIYMVEELAAGVQVLMGVGCGG